MAPPPYPPGPVGLFPAGETVVRLRAEETVDRYGNTVRDWSNADRLEIAGCGVAPRTSTEESDMGREGVIVGVSVYAPPGADIGPHDRIEARGTVWEVVGEVADWRNPYTGWHAGIVAHLRRVDG